MAKKKRSTERQVGREEGLLEAIQILRVFHDEAFSRRIGDVQAQCTIVNMAIARIRAALPRSA